MKLLIAVVNARSRQSTWAEAVRSTWKDTFKGKADVIFFVGRAYAPYNVALPADTVVLDCDDSYEGLPDKVREIVRWAYARDYDFMLKCDDDTVLDCNGLMNSGFDRHDYTGRANRPPTSENPFWVPMGFNYWLSRKSMSIVRDADLPENSNDDERWVATILYRSGILLYDDHRYRLKYGYKMPSMKRPLRMKRPMRPTVPDEEPNAGSFSWCIFLEGNSGNLISLGIKLGEFHRVYEEFVKHEDSDSSS